MNFLKTIKISEDDLVTCAWCMTINSLDYKFSRTFFYEFIRKEDSDKIVKHVSESKDLFEKYGIFVILACGDGIETNAKAVKQLIEKYGEDNFFWEKGF
jgi:hypothetical protein